MADALHQRTRRQRFIDLGLCAYCGKNPKGRTLACNPCLTKRWRKGEYSREKAQERKLLTFQAYGGIFCKCCGETNPIFLTIDHVNNDGAEHRRKIHGRRDGGNIYSWLKAHRFPPGFQVLCFNCNHGKYLNRGICPHQQNLLALAAS